MATYTVQAPDGKTVTLQGPDGASHDDVIAQAQKLYQPSSAAAPSASAQGAAGTYRPSSSLTPQAAQSAIDNASAQLEQHIANLPDTAKTYARNRFFQNPTIAALRVASAVPVSSKTGAHAGAPIQSIAPAIRTMTDFNPITAPISRAMSDDQINSLAAGFSRGVPGSERLAAGVEDLMGNGDGNTLDTIRSQSNEEMAKAPIVGAAGQVLGAGAAGVAGGSALGAAAEGTPVAAALETATQAAPTLTPLATAAAGGATGAGVSAADQGEPILPAMATGAVAGPALMGAGKLATLLGAKAANVLGLANAGAILKSMTSASRDAIQTRVDAAVAQGRNPTLFEVLPMVDRNRISKNIVSRSDNTLEQTQNLVNQRVGNIGPEMAQSVGAATNPGRTAITDQMSQDLAAARGPNDGPPAPAAGDDASAAFASRDPIAMDNFRQTEDRSIMAPHDDTELFDNVGAIMPQHPELQDDGAVHMVPDDPAVSAMIARKAGLLTRKQTGQASGGLTGRNISDLLGQLRDQSGNPNDPARDVAAAAAQHIEGVLEEAHPEFLAANARMRAANAGRARMQEGMTEGARTRTRGDLGDVTQANKNAYNTPEGGAGRFLGQANDLESGFGQAAPGNAIRTAAGLPNDQAAIRANLGQGPADQIAQAAAGQTEGARALAGLTNKKGSNAEEAGPQDLALMVLGLNPASMIRTKVGVLGQLTKLARIPEDKARNLVDLLFSTDAAQRGRALNMLNSIPQGQKVLNIMRNALGSGAAVQAGKSAVLPAAPQPQETVVPPVNPTPQPAASEAEPPLPQGFTPDAEGANPQPQETDVPSIDPASESITPPTPDISNMSPAAQDLMRQIQAAGAAPGQENDKTPYGHRVVQALFPSAHITSDVRSKDDPLSKKNPGSYHTTSDKAVDVRPIPGMSFTQFISEIHQHGYHILEARDEEKHPIPGLTTGKHWHVVIA